MKEVKDFGLTLVYDMDEPKRRLDIRTYFCHECESSWDVNGTEDLKSFIENLQEGLKFLEGKK